jgi:hypothetical protein
MSMRGARTKRLNQRELRTKREDSPELGVEERVMGPPRVLARIIHEGATADG